MSIPPDCPQRDERLGWMGNLIVPWTISQMYGDTRILERHYGAMVRGMNYLDGANPNHLWTTATVALPNAETPEIGSGDCEFTAMSLPQGSFNTAGA